MLWWQCVHKGNHFLWGWVNDEWLYVAFVHYLPLLQPPSQSHSNVLCVFWLFEEFCTEAHRAKTVKRPPLYSTVWFLIFLPIEPGADQSVTDSADRRDWKPISTVNPFVLLPCCLNVLLQTGLHVIISVWDRECHFLWGNPQQGKGRGNWGSWHTRWEKITQSLLSRNKEQVLCEGSFLKRGEEVRSDSLCGLIRSTLFRTSWSL